MAVSEWIKRGATSWVAKGFEDVFDAGKDQSVGGSDGHD
jgi:hypothetical protein